MFRVIALAALALNLAGCDKIKAGFVSPTEKVNAAYPMPDETQLARARLLGALEADKAAQQAMMERLDKLLNVRALTCMSSASFGRFDTVAEIKAKGLNPQCFKKQDASLDEWIGVARIAAALKAPPLLPLAPLPGRTVITNPGESIASISVAMNANVMVFRNYSRVYKAVTLPEGKPISTFQVAEPSGRTGTISPNGRLYAVPLNRGMKVIEVETGNAIWSTEKYSDVVAWMPQVDAVVLAVVNTVAAEILDTRRSTFEPYPVSSQFRLGWALPMAGDQSLMVTSNAAVLVEHKRTASGALDITAIKQLQIPSTGMANAPMLMGNGKKLVYYTGSELMSVDLDSGTSQSWPFLLVSAGMFAKVSESTLMFDGKVNADAHALVVTKLVDLDKKTVSTPKDFRNGEGPTFSMAPRTGYLKRGNMAVMVGDSAEAIEPTDLEQYLGDAQIAQQMAQMEVADQMRRRGEMPNIPPGTPDYAREAMLAGAEANARINAMRAGRPMPGTMGAVPLSAMPPAAKPLLADVPADAKVAVIGVYGTGDNQRGQDSHAMRPIRVTVGPGTKPLVLVLTSYEPVMWVINTGGRKIAAILQSGYYPSKVVGQGDTQTLKIGSTHAYKMDSADYERLKLEVARYVSAPVQSFQGGYNGKEFSVN